MNDVLARPVGRGQRLPARLRRGGSALVYAVSATLSGGLFAAGFAIAWRTVFSFMPFALLCGLVSTSIVCVVLLELAGRVDPLPERRKQVPRRWLLWKRSFATAAAFGIVIGSGWMTHLRHPTWYALPLLIALRPSPLVGASLGLAYGATRGLAVLVTYSARAWFDVSVPWEGLFRRVRIVRISLAAAALSTMACAIWIVG
jgi:hypothetical protein